jgi:4a-hydroxytetrahydrobiopterin dehydratase
MEKIIKKYIFKDFNQAIEFVNQIAEVANKLDHHPNIKIYDYKKVEVEIYTHSENALTNKDYELEKEVDKIYKRLS